MLNPIILPAELLRQLQGLGDAVRCLPSIELGITAPPMERLGGPCLLRGLGVTERRFSSRAK
jgi:hypothetical protein